MRSILSALGPGLVLFIMAGASGSAVAAAGDHIGTGEHVKISPDGRRVGYVEDSSNGSMLWVSSITNPEDRRPVTIWTENDQAFEWADDHYLALAKQVRSGTVLVVMPVDGASDPIQSRVLPGKLVRLSKDAIDSVVAVASGDQTEALRYSQSCACFTAGVAAKATAPQSARLDNLWVWSASWDGAVLLVSDSDVKDGADVFVYSPRTRLARPLFTGDR